MADPGTRSSVDDDLRAAIARSTLRHLDEDDLDRLLAKAGRRWVPAGTLLRRTGDAGPHLELVVRGFVRIFVAAPDGRTLTIRYVRPGDLMGAVSVFRSRYAMPGSLQAVVDTELLAIRPETARQLAADDPIIAAAFLDELSERIVQFVAEIPRTAFATVRQRVARHLLDLASERQHDATLYAPISQQQLAEAVGSVREVVVRALRELRGDGRIRTGHGGVEILEPEALWAEVIHDHDPAPG
jgi:CRP/FNR family transcriptional regulator